MGQAQAASIANKERPFVDALFNALNKWDVVLGWSEPSSSVELSLGGD
jgi:hypothetical protein